MYSREKSRKNHNMNEPSFSSTLLDEIYRSIDANAENTEDSKFLSRDYNYKLVKGQVNFRGNGNTNCYSVEDEEIMAAGVRRGRLVEKWMLKEGNDNLSARRDALAAESAENKSFKERDLLYFSSSFSDSSGALSSSSDDQLLMSSSTKARVSCFSSVARPKPVRIGGKNRQEEILDDYKMGDENLFKSKSRAFKVYASLRKVKQPISPGGKLTSFINSLFNHGSENKLKKNVDSKKGKKVGELETSSNCSPPASSCLISKNSSKEKMRNGTQRTVRFDPAGSIILNEEEYSRPSGSNIMYNGSHYSSATMDHDDLKLRPRYCAALEQEDDDDAISDSSSDLFELDHLQLSLFGHDQELPMYETTHCDVTNRPIRM